jgi:hypothetical protein
VCEGPAAPRHETEEAGHDQAADEREGGEACGMRQHADGHGAADRDEVPEEPNEVEHRGAPA